MTDLQDRLRNLMFISNQAVNAENQHLYAALIMEEYDEWKEAFLDDHPADLEFKELCDLMWVILQYANQRGWNMTVGMNRLISEYMSKFYTSDGKYEPLFREDGKLLKNTGFQKADFKDLV